MNTLPPYIPSYKSGYARNASESGSPGLWRGLAGGWYPTLGITGLTLRDVSRRGDHGTLTGATWVQGPRGWVLDYDGVTTTKVAASQVVSGYPFTMMVQCKLNQTNVKCAAISVGHGSVGNESCYIYFKDDATAYHVVNGVASGGVAYAADTWYMAVGVFVSATSRVLYLNNIAGAVGTANRTPSSFQDTWIGNVFNSGSELPLNGQIELAGIWSRALVVAEIAELTADPHALIRPPSTITTFPALAVGTTIRWPWQLRRRRRTGAA